jgi:hypothetical protein
VIGGSEEIRPPRQAQKWLARAADSKPAQVLILSPGAADARMGQWRQQDFSKESPQCCKARLFPFDMEFSEVVVNPEEASHVR